MTVASFGQKAIAPFSVGILPMNITSHRVTDNHRAVILQRLKRSGGIDVLLDDRKRASRCDVCRYGTDWYPHTVVIGDP